MTLPGKLNRKTQVAVLLIITIVSFLSCEKNSSSPIPLVLPATISYNKNIQPLFNLYCALSGCHAGSRPSARLDLSDSVSYTALIKGKGMIDTLNPQNSRLYTSLSSPMPPWGRLIPYDIDIILEWIKQGAKNN